MRRRSRTGRAGGCRGPSCRRLPSRSGYRTRSAGSLVRRRSSQSRRTTTDCRCFGGSGSSASLVCRARHRRACGFAHIAEYRCLALDARGVHAADVQVRSADNQICKSSPAAVVLLDSAGGHHGRWRGGADGEDVAVARSCGERSLGTAGTVAIGR